MSVTETVDKTSISLHHINAPAKPGNPIVPSELQHALEPCHHWHEDESSRPPVGKQCIVIVLLPNIHHYHVALPLCTTCAISITHVLMLNYLCNKELQTVKPSLLCCKIHWSGAIICPLVDRTGMHDIVQKLLMNFQDHPKGVHPKL